jgi:multiple sugar transport system ATP-binding protein
VTVFLDHVTKVYDGDVRAVDDVQLQVAKGEVVVLLGPSGCGKTTILRMIAGLEEVTSGKLWLNGELANDLSTQDRNIAMVFQHGALYPHCTVRKNIAFPLEVAGVLDKPSMDARVRELARGLGIEATLDRRPSMLSGGERQRVAIGRALSKSDRAVLLMDEPLASLDASRRHGLREEIGALVRSLDLTTIYVTHDQVEALALADRIAVLRDGALEDIGSPTQVYGNPATAFVASFLGSPPINLLSATVWVEHGQRVVIDFGSQQLQLPWTDPRAEILTQYQSLTVLVGISRTCSPRPGSPRPGRCCRAGFTRSNITGTSGWPGWKWGSAWSTSTRSKRGHAVPLAPAGLPPRRGWSAESCRGWAPGGPGAPARPVIPPRRTIASLASTAAPTSSCAWIHRAGGTLGRWSASRSMWRACTCSTLTASASTRSRTEPATANPVS